MAREVAVKLVGDSTGLNRAFRTAGISANRFGRTATRSSKISRGAFRAIGIGAIPVIGGIVAGLKKSVDLAGEFQSSLSKFQGVSGASAGQMKKVRDQALALGADLKLPGTSANDAAEAMTELAKSGLSVKQVQKAVRATLLLSAAAGVDNATAAEITSNALNAFGIDAGKTKTVVDQLAGTANASSVEITDVADAFKMAAAVFSGFQGPAVGSEGAITELNTAIGILGNAGIKGSDAGTSLKQMLLQLTGPSSKAKDAMAALAVASKDTSVSQEDLQIAIGSPSAKSRHAALARLLDHAGGLTKNLGDIAYTASGKMRSLPDILDMVAKGTKGMNDETKNAYLTQIFGADATRAVIGLLKSGSQGWGKMTTAVQKQGTAQKIANSRMKGFHGAMEGLKSSAETLGTKIGLVLLPILTRWANKISAWLGKAKNQKRIIQGVKEAVRVFSGVLQTSAHWLRIAAKFARGFSNAVGGWENAAKIVLGGLLITKMFKLAQALRLSSLWAFRTGRNIRRIPPVPPGAGGFGPGGGRGRGNRGGRGGLPLGGAGLVAGGLGVAGALGVGLGQGGVSSTPTGKWQISSGVGDLVTYKDPLTGKFVMTQKRAGESPQQAAVRDFKRRHPNVRSGGGRGRGRQGGSGAVRGSTPVVRTSAGADAGGGTVVQHHHHHINLDGKEVAKVTTKHQQRHDKRNGAQRAGRHGGRTR